MAQTIKLKRSSTGGAVPSTSSLSLGEVAINTYDGKVYIKKNDGSDAIVEIGAGNGEAVWTSYDYTATSSQTSFTGSDNNSATLSYVPGFLQVFLNGVLLDPAVDYAATTGNSVVLTVGATTSDLLQIETFTQIIGTGDILVDTFPVSSTQTAFTLSQDPINKNNISVYVEGVYQESSTYSLSGTTLTLSESPANGTTVEVVIGTRNVTLDGIVDLTISGTLHAGALDLGDANIINVNEISLDTIKGDADANTNITFAGSDVTTFTQGGTERLRLNTTGAEVTGNIVVSGTVDGRDVAADGVTADAALSRAGGAMGGAITTNSTFDGRDVSVDGTKLDGIESGATADQTDVEIRAAVESASDSNVFTNADHSKLDAIEALADVTDATNVTAAGALMKAGGTMTGAITNASFGSQFATTLFQQNVIKSSVASQQGAFIRMAVSNAGNPTYAFEDDTNTGMFTSGADTLNFTTGGTERLRIDSAGQVGIGNISPAQTLEIHNSVAGDYTDFGLRGTGHKYVIGVGNDAVATVNDKWYLYDNDNSAFRMVVDTSGNVGIGTSSPSSELTIGADTPQIDLLKASSADVLANIRAETDAGTGGKLVFQTKRNGNTALDRMTIDDDGNVGIGRNPSYLVHAENATSTGQSVIATSGNGAFMMAMGSQNSPGVAQEAFIGTLSDTRFKIKVNNVVKASWTDGGLAIGTQSSALSPLDVQLHSGGGRRFLVNYDDSLITLKGSNASQNPESLRIVADTFRVYTGTSGSGTERMSISNTGNVGIGTGSNFGKLSVNVSAGAPATSGNMTNGLTVHNTNGGRAIQLGVNESGGYTFINSAYVNSAGNSQPMAFFTGGSERMRIDSSGNVLVGKISTNVAVAGCRLGSFGAILTRGDGSEPLRVNRTGSDGEIIKIDKDGSTVGSIGVTSGSIAFGQSNTALGAFNTDRILFPATAAGGVQDNAIDLGYSGGRFKDLYLSGGIQSAGNSTFTSATPLSFNKAGTDTYTKTVLYDSQNNTANGVFSGLTLEMGRLTNSSSATARTFTISDRGATNRWCFSQYGLSFNPTASVATAAESLDDYEEGTFQMSASGVSGGVFGYGKYVKIGALVHWQWYSGAMNVTGSGYATLSGLPFAATSSTGYYSTFSTGHSTYAGTATTGYLQAGGFNAYITSPNTTSSASYVAGNPKYVMASGTYYTDS